MRACMHSLFHLQTTLISISQNQLKGEKKKDATYVQICGTVFFFFCLFFFFFFFFVFLLLFALECETNRNFVALGSNSFCCKKKKKKIKE